MNLMRMSIALDMISQLLTEHGDKPLARNMIFGKFIIAKLFRRCATSMATLRNLSETRLIALSVVISRFVFPVFK
jgi:hypothetical protein